MTKTEREKLKDLLIHFQQREDKPGVPQIITEIKSCILRGEISKELAERIDGYIQLVELEIQMNKKEMAENAGRALVDVFGPFMPIIIPSLARQEGESKS